jgi:hypothetical protein
MSKNATFTNKSQQHVTFEYTVGEPCEIDGVELTVAKFVLDLFDDGATGLYAELEYTPAEDADELWAEIEYTNVDPYENEGLLELVQSEIAALLTSWGVAAEVVAEVVADIDYSEHGQQKCEVAHFDAELFAEELRKRANFPLTADCFM